MFPSTRRTIAILFKTPLVPVSSAPPALELTTMTRAGPSRPRAATRTYSNMSFRSVAQVEAYGNGNSMSRRGYASDHGKKELYSDEAGSSGAGVSRHLITLCLGSGVPSLTLGLTPFDRSVPHLILLLTMSQTDDVAHSDAAFNKDPNPESAAKDIEKEVSNPDSEFARRLNIMHRLARTTPNDHRPMLPHPNP